MTDPLPWTVQPGRVRLALRVTPRASRPGLAGVVAASDGRTALAIRVAAPPADGAANLAVVAVLAEALGVGRSAVTIAGGATSRFKQVEIHGDPAALVERLRLAIG